MRQTHPRPANDPKRSQPGSQPAAPSNVPFEDDEDDGSRFLLFNVMPSWMVSFLTHIAVIVVLAIMVMPEKKERTVALEAGEPTAEALDSIEMDFDALEFNTADALETEMPVETPTDIMEEMEVSLPVAEFDVGNTLGSFDSFDTEMIGELNPSDMASETGSRSGASKSRMLKEYGGTPASEAAVALALEWIVKHQLPDGGWSFDHTQGPGSFRNSPNPGDLTRARCAATSMAILPLLGAGHTHQQGEYKEVVRKGLAFLISQSQRGKKGISYLEPGGTMYSHGLTAIVFCEAFAMTKDPELGEYAQGTIWFIEYAQDPIGGGWKYVPREPGDTSVVGWQMMALKSAKISGLAIEPRTYKLAEKFLDSVSNSGGAYYGYGGPPSGSPADARSAVGLLCRMYMGWDKDVPGLVDGVANIAEKGPSADPAKSSVNMYYNYYATQMMKQIGGRQWTAWNNEMRDFLVASQANESDGNAAGSWFFQNQWSPAGGRLYDTSLACMTLEVYYRYLPLYGESATSKEFPLD